MAARGSRAWPYRRITGDTVKATNWVIDPDTADEREVPGTLPDWDYQTNLRLRRRLTVDARVCREVTGLAENVPLAVSVRWHATPSLLRGSAAWIPLTDDMQEYLIDVDVFGEQLGGVLLLETIIVLAGPAEPRPAAAHLIGSNVWNDAVEIRLQGDAPLFPIAQIPFSGAGLPDRAAWYVEIGADLDASALGALQLLVNQGHKPIVAAVARAASPNDVDRALLSALRSDIVRTMLERAIEDEAFDMTARFAKESLGAVLQGLLRTYMSEYVDDDLLEIRRIRASDPPLFAAIVQAATDFMADEK